MKGIQSEEGKEQREEEGNGKMREEGREDGGRGQMDEEGGGKREEGECCK